jgi:hypothetical protein
MSGDAFSCLTDLRRQVDRHEWKLLSGTALQCAPMLLSQCAGVAELLNVP